MIMYKCINMILYKYVLCKANLAYLVCTTSFYFFVFVLSSVISVV